MTVLAKNNPVLAKDMRGMWIDEKYPPDFIVGYCVKEVGIQEKFALEEIAAIRAELGDSAFELANKKPAE